MHSSLAGTAASQAPSPSSPQVRRPSQVPAPFAVEQVVDACFSMAHHEQPHAPSSTGTQWPSSHCAPSGHSSSAPHAVAQYEPSPGPAGRQMVRAPVSSGSTQSLVLSHGAQ
ncbi:MAG: hypothetical protein U1F43_09125 [Myxococcota bacterium]